VGGWRRGGHLALNSAHIAVLFLRLRPNTTHDHDAWYIPRRFSVGAQDGYFDQWDRH